VFGTKRSVEEVAQQRLESGHGTPDILLYSSLFNTTTPCVGCGQQTELRACILVVSTGVNDKRPNAAVPSLAGNENSPADSRHLILSDRQFIKAEANLLRLPLFALSTKGLRTLDGIECRGLITRNGTVHEYKFRATRNTNTLYPGPLARSAHLAILSIATEHGVPIMNPVEWSWRDLCRRMGVVTSGRTVTQLQEAIFSTAGVMLWSEMALYDKTDKKPMDSRKNALHLYEEVSFHGQVRPDGSKVDANTVKLADWYVRNLNSLFTAPLNYSLWRQLDAKSTIASRLYEFLLLNFHRRIPVLRVNYPTLAQMLPIRPERYFSSAQKQLAEPLRVLTDQRVLAEVVWTRTREGLPQLQFRRGDHLRSPGAENPAFAEAEGEYAVPVQLKELRNLRSAENTLVSEFYRLWAGEESHRTTVKELDQARQLVLEHGTSDAKKLLPAVVNRLRSRWPAAKTIMAAARYFPEVAQEHAREQQQKRQQHLAREQRAAEREKLDDQQKETRRFRETWKPIWDALPLTEREAIQQTVLTNPFMVRLAAKRPESVEFQYLRELAKRRNSTGLDEAETATRA
jgi:hypothetical protein